MDPFENRLRDALRRREPPPDFDEKVLARVRLKTRRSFSLWQVLRWTAGHPLRLAASGGVAIALVAGGIHYEQRRVEQTLQAATAPGIISGKILSMDGTPAAGMRIAAMTVQDAAAAGQSSLLSLVETDPSGRYRLEGLPPGPYCIIAGALAAPTYYPGVSDHARADIVNVTAGSELSGKDFSIVAPLLLTVKGRVVHENNSNYDTTRNTLGLRAADGTWQSTGIEPDGSFQIAVRPGTYRPMVNGSFFSDSITVADRDIAGLQILVPLPVSVHGTVRVADGLPVPRFELTFTHVNSGAQYTAVPLTAVLGSNEVSFFVNLWRGSYRVIAGGFPAGYILQSITANSKNLPDEVLTLSDATETKTAVVLSTSFHPPSFKVNGRITGGGAFNPGARPQTVQLAGATVWGELNASIGADGTFEFPVVVPGKYNIRIGHGIPGPTIFVSDHDLMVVIPTPEARKIQGKVSVDGGGALPRFTLRFLRIFAREDSVVTSAGSGMGVSPGPDGSFSVSVPDGEYLVGVDYSNPGGYSVRAFRYGEIDLLENPIVVDGNTKTFQVTLARANETNTKSIPTLVSPGVLNRAEFPGILDKVPAVYSDEGRRNKIEGRVWLQVTIHPDGSLDSDIEVVLSLGFGLDEQAIEAVRQWKFRPGGKNGVPVQGKMWIEIPFRLQTSVP